MAGHEGTIIGNNHLTDQPSSVEAPHEETVEIKTEKLGYKTTEFKIY